MPRGPSVRHQRDEHSLRREAVARSGPRGLTFWLAFYFEHKGTVSRCLAALLVKKGEHVTGFALEEIASG